MIGLPGETDVDVVGIAETVAWLQRECRERGRKPLNFNLTISNFTPKPHTPFQWHSVATAEFQRKRELLRYEFRRMRGVKVNFTDVRISAMEDFIGRGDRHLGKVLLRAWQLGAGMDSWFENADKAFSAWNQAIAEADKIWKYRQVENGEWNLFNLEEVEEGEQGGQVSNITSLSPPSPSLDRPLPWDHIDTGIDKKWLKDDLERALAYSTVPDCSFDGCSHCGVCGTDFGHNIVIAPPSIPKFAGNFVPNTNKVQRLRVWFGKIGDMALIGHLDLMRLFDRAIRRAKLPIAFTGGFHPNPRISLANALPLGATSSGEIADIELTQVVKSEDFCAQLSAALPDNIPIYNVEELDLKAPAATQVLEAAEYIITVRAINQTTPRQWLEWIDTIKAYAEILQEQTTKSGNIQLVNLRDRLKELEVLETDINVCDTYIKLRYLGSCRNDGTLLRPEQILFMLEKVANAEFQLLHFHRNRLVLRS